MVCYNPILMYPVEGAITKSGKQHYSFYGSLASHPELACDNRFIRCSCKQCIGCRLENSRQWAVRAVHEARSSSSAYFVTCTFDDYHLPRDKSLSKKFHQTFMKNLRREYGSGIRFLGCGEYGELHGRPHYHYILFNIDFDDKIFRFRTDGYNTYTSSRFAKVWKYGMHLIGEFISAFRMVPLIATPMPNSASGSISSGVKPPMATIGSPARTGMSSSLPISRFSSSPVQWIPSAIIQRA